MNHKSPCLGCTKRWVNEFTTCHSGCNAYISFAAAAKNTGQVIREEKQKPNYSVVYGLQRSLSAAAKKRNKSALISTKPNR